MATGPVVETLRTHPELVVVLVILLRAGLAYQRSLSWYEYRTLHGLRRLVFPILQRRLPFDSFVNTKGGRDDAEFLRTVDQPARAVAKRLRRSADAYHLLSSLKERPATHGDPHSRAHVVWTHDDGRQTEAYLFQNSDGSTDVYGHIEHAVTHPIKHLTTGQRDGDPRGLITDALDGE